MLIGFAVAFCWSVNSARAEDELPLAGPAYTDANEAYAAYKAGDFTTAAAKAREAIALRPDSAKLRLLLIDSLTAGGNLEEADATATEAISRFGNNPDITSRLATVRERIAYKSKSSSYEFADAALKAFAQQDYQAAASAARKAVAIDPTNRSYRLILINSLIAAKDYDEANTQANDAIQKIGKDSELSARQDYIREQIAARPIADAYTAADAAYKAYDQKDYASAIRLARKAITLDPTNSSYRELLQNSEKAANAPRSGGVVSRGAALAQSGYTSVRKKNYEAAIRNFSAALRAGLPAPSQSRNVRLALADAYLASGDGQGALTALQPFGPSTSYDVAARRGYAYQNLHQDEDALQAFETAYASARTSRERYSAVSAAIGLLAKVGRKQEARALFDRARADGLLQAPAADIANLALIVGDDQTASEYYGQMRAHGELRGTSLLNAGYLATKLGRNQDAIQYFEDGIDAYNSGQLSVSPQELFTVRRQVAEMSRTWGVFSSATFSKVGSGPGFLSLPAASGGSAIQVGTELYWRPFQYQNGSVFDVFVRAFETPYNELGGEGLKTTQGMFGARWKPFGQINWIVEAARVFAIGSESRNDYLLRTAFSYAQGTDLRVDVNNWATWQFYADYNYFTEIAERTASLDLRVGQSYRLDAISPYLVWFPHVGAFANYDNKLARPEAYSLGAGATLRYWFREDKYRAPMSYVDITGQYRFRVGGDERAQGPFVQVFVNY